MVRTGKMGYDRLVEAMSIAPRRILGIDPVSILSLIHILVAGQMRAIACLEQRRYVMRDVFPQGIEGVS